MAQIIEIFDAREKIKDETNRWNVGLQSLVREVTVIKLSGDLPAPKTG